MPDGVVSIVDQHQDSVYSACWSAVDPWCFGTVGYDGHVVIGVVPSETKYKIIL